VQNLESEYGFLSDSDWSRSAFFVNLLKWEWSRGLESNFKIETKADASVNCDFDVTMVSQSLKSSESEWSWSMILEKLSKSDWSRN